MTEEAELTRTFAAGDCYVVVGERVTAFLPVEARDRVAGLWDLADGGAGFEQMLDGLLAGGLSSLAGFALVGHGERTRVLVRGDVSATFWTAQGEIAIADGADALWAEGTLDGVTGGRISVGSLGNDLADLPLVAGVARASAVHFGVVGAGPVEPAVEASASVVAAEVQEGRAPFEGEPTESVTEPEPEPVSVPEPLPGPATELMSEPVFEEASNEPLTFGAPHVDDPTPTGEQPAVIDEAEYPALDHDGQTTVGASPQDFDRPQVGIPGQEVAPAVVAHPVAKLIFSTGEVIDVDRVILVGRAPEARRFASSDQPHLVTVSSPNHEISSTHLEIRPGAGADHGMAVVTDMGSTNGTVLVQPGLPPEDLQAGIAVSLMPGAILDLGDGVTIQTTNP